MTAEIINLRQARKRRARDQKATQAEENRARFGRTRAEREQEELAQTRAAQVLDGHLRDTPIVETRDETSSSTANPVDGGATLPTSLQSPPRSSQ